MNSKNNIKFFNGNGGYIFISHSHKDLPYVRIIRNSLESFGFEPILFYLRCMDIGINKDLNLLKNLIYDEIDSRDFFLYIKSKNSEQSLWVQDELNHFKTNSNKYKKMETIDIDEISNKFDEKYADNLALDIVKKMSVFISFHINDLTTFDNLSSLLIYKGYRVYNPFNDVLASGSWALQIDEMIKEASMNGYYVWLISNSSLSSKLVETEFFKAKEMNAKIFPIIIEELSNENKILISSLFEDQLINCLNNDFSNFFDKI